MAETHTIEILDPDLCSGCGSCCNVCPKDAIRMEYNAEGFHAPKIDREKCISCGLCEKSCPALHPYKENDPEPLVYAVKGSEDILKESTSGGVFAVLADYILDKKGYVCGAAYDESFEVWHKIENTAEGVRRIKKSKYVQSQTGLIFREIKKLLKEGQWVLFSGAPCQVAGLHRFLEKRYEKLYTLDIICHGAPAPVSWKRYLEENIDMKKLKDIDFRHKGDHGFKRLHICFSYHDGTEDIQPSSKNVYYNHFLKNLGLRKSCAACEGAVTPRVGDFSAGDFWGAQKHYPELIASDSGLSVLFLNNAHARELLPYLEKQFPLMKKVTVNEAMTSNRCHVTRGMHCNRDRFFRMMQENTFAEAVRKNMGKPFDVAVYGNTVGTNYGGVITYYALYKAILDMGYSVVMIGPPKRKKKEKKSHAVRFCKENIVLSDEKPLNKYGEYNTLAKIFVLGSDQVWNYKLFSGRKLSFYLDFVDDTKKKIAYGASFGFDVPTVLSFRPEQYLKSSALMKRIDQIAVRESSAVDVCREYYEVPATHVVDPVFLLRAEDYDALSQNAVNKPEGPYMAIYSLSPKESLNRGFQFVSQTLNLPRVNMTTGNMKKWKLREPNFDMPYCKNLQMEEWLYNLRNSEFVMTDSYHCVCFSIIFRKNFVLVQEEWAVSRMTSLLSKLNLMDRWFNSSEELIAHPEVLNTPIDYDAVYEILDRDIAFSRNWLAEALESEKKVYDAEPLKRDKEMKQLYDSIYRSLTINSWMKQYYAKREDLILVMVRKGGNFRQFSRTVFFKDSQVGAKVKKELKKGNGFAYIVDAKAGVICKEIGKYAHVSYLSDGVWFSAVSEGINTPNEEETAEIYIEKDGIRTIYSCKMNGLYGLLYSRSMDKVIDHIRVDMDHGLLLWPRRVKRV